jgi:hypothetical protein
MTEIAVSKAEAAEAFDKLTLVDESLQAPAPNSNQYEPLRTWLGHLVQEDHSEHYISSREMLSDAAYWGNWEVFWPALKIGKEQYDESWINAIRLSKVPLICSMYQKADADSFMHTEPLKLADKISYWTPLHQAVYNHTDNKDTIGLIEQMISAGAFRKSFFRRPSEIFQLTCPF